VFIRNVFGKTHLLKQSRPTATAYRNKTKPM